MLQILWNKEIEKIKHAGYLKENTLVTDALIENFFDQILGLEEKLLLKLVLSKNPQQNDLDNLLNLWNIEKKHGAKSLILSYLLKSNPNLKATEYEEPRLKGLLLNQRFKNLNTLSHFKKIGTHLNNNNIIPLVFNDGLMKSINPNYPRYINDINLIVSNKHWVKSAKIAKSLGYHFRRINHDTFAILETKNSKEGIMDFCKNILPQAKNQKKLIKNITQRAKTDILFGIEAYIPSFEDILFVLLIGISDNLRCDKTYADLLNKILDCNFILKNYPELNWNIIVENTKLAGLEVKLNFAVKFIKKISKNIIPDNSTFFEKETNDYSNMVLFENLYYSDLQKECRALKFKEIFKNPALIKKYITLKTKYKFLKSLNNHPKLIQILIKDLNKIYSN